MQVYETIHVCLQHGRKNWISFSNTQAAAWVYLNGLLTNGNAVFKFNEHTQILQRIQNNFHIVLL